MIFFPRLNWRGFFKLCLITVLFIICVDTQFANQGLFPKLSFEELTLA